MRLLPGCVPILATKLGFPGHRCREDFGPGNGIRYQWGRRSAELVTYYVTMSEIEPMGLCQARPNLGFGFGVSAPTGVSRSGFRFCRFMALGKCE
jgi:hypothetical protein